MLKRYCDRCQANMYTASCFRFEYDNPDWQDPKALDDGEFEEEPEEEPQPRSPWTLRLSVRSPKIECDLCTDCLRSFADWFVLVTVQPGSRT